ncbi:hypothetical protein AVEN_67510-1, partial [Araneus ventricosus]
MGSRDNCAKPPVVAASLGLPMSNLGSCILHVTLCFTPCSPSKTLPNQDLPAGATFHDGNTGSSSKTETNLQSHYN